MLEIIKYQLKGRKGSMLLILAIFGILNVIAFGLEIAGVASGARNVNMELGFWIVMACMATGIITMIMFFMCSAGHVDSLLYKDTSYLMLTVPRHGWEILGGRFIAGLAEFALYFIVAGFLASVHVTLVSPISGDNSMNPVRLFFFMYEQVFVINFITVAKLTALGICIFALTGSLLTFAFVASRSFVKNKGIATAISITVFFLITNWATRLGVKLSESLNWYWNIQLSNKTGQSLIMRDCIEQMPAGFFKPVQIPVASVLFGLLLAAALFAAASWLMEKKVEL